MIKLTIVLAMLAILAIGCSSQNAIQQDSQDMPVPGESSAEDAVVSAEMPVPEESPVDEMIVVEE